MSLILPSWFKQRQGKAEPAGDNVYRLTGPNLRPADIGVRADGGGKWSAFLRFDPDGPDAAATEPLFETAFDAWEAAFELYRTRVVV
jgi:hypothetical protein